MSLTRHRELDATALLVSVIRQAFQFTVLIGVFLEIFQCALVAEVASTLLRRVSSKLVGNRSNLWIDNNQRFLLQGDANEAMFDMWQIAG